MAVTAWASLALAEDRPAYRAEDFIESIGLAASPFDKYLAQGQFKGAGTKYPPELFFELGVRYYRTALRYDLTNPRQAELVAEWWKKTGARPMLLVDAGKSKTLKADWMKVKEDGDFSFLLEDLRKYVPGSVAMIEAPNELNNKFPPQDLNLRYRGLTDEAAGSRYQHDLQAALRSDTQTKSIPLVMYTAIFTDYALARPCDAFDFLNMHSYQGSGVPSSSLLMNMTRTANILPRGAVIKPFVPTECGYNVEEDKANHQGYNGSRQAQAYNNPMLLAEYFRHGIHRTFLFALHNADGYGLLESDQATRRPSWHAMKSLIELLADARWNGGSLRWEGGRTFSPRALRFDVQGPTTVHTLTLQKQNGDWYLLIWNEVENFRNGRNAHNAPLPVKLEFAPETAVTCLGAYGQGIIPEDVYAAPEGVQQGAFHQIDKTPAVQGNAISLQVPSAVLILQLRPRSAPAAATIPAPIEVGGDATENTAKLRVALPPQHGAASVLLFRNDMHIATLAPAEHVTYEDRSAWLRPGLGYRYAAQTVAADGRMSARAEAVITTPDRRPDLVVGEFGPDLPPGAVVHPGDKVRFRGTVRNAGKGATPMPTPPNVGMWNSAVSISFSVDGKVISWGGDDGREPFPPGTSRSHVASGGPKGHEWTAQEGTHVLRAYVDDINRISSESDKLNNYATETITVGSYKGRLWTGSRPAPGRVDLSAEGREDWVHFGAWKDQGTASRKRDANLLGTVTQLGQGFVATTLGCPISLGWTNGSGRDREQDTHAGLWGNNVGNGFTFTAPADKRERVLRVYVAGIEGAQCEFSATLSDDSAPAVKDTAWNGNRANNWSPVPAGFSAVYEVRYRAASDGQTLRIGWKLIGEPNRFLGQVRLQAATLSRDK